VNLKTVIRIITVINMDSLKSAICLLTLSLLTLLSLTAKAAPTYAAHTCSNSTFFTPNSTYQVNLNLLLSALSSNATRRGGFYTATVGQAPPDVVIGRLLCRADLSPDLCENCISTAMSDIRNRCPADKVGLIWYDECTLQYSNESYLSDKVPFKNLPTTNQNVVELDQFNTLLSTTMKSLATQAANSQSDKKFAGEEVKFTSSQTLYCMVQCSPEMNAELCMSCLESAIGSVPQCCTGKQGGKVLLPSSNIRYELFPFYDLTAVSPGSPSLPPPGTL
jgi:hypothetical protein